MEYAYSILPRAGTSLYLDLCGSGKLEMATAKFLLFLPTEERAVRFLAVQKAGSLEFFFFLFIYHISSVRIYLHTEVLEHFF